MTDEKDNRDDIIQALCQALMDKYDPPQAIAILSSLITHIYAQGDSSSAFILAQPDANVVVVTASLDSLDALPEVIDKTFQSLEEAQQQEEFETTPKRPPDSKLH